jgi:hypothetical protein
LSAHHTTQPSTTSRRTPPRGDKPRLLHVTRKTRAKRLREHGVERRRVGKRDGARPLHNYTRDKPYSIISPRAESRARKCRKIKRTPCLKNRKRPRPRPGGLLDNDTGPWNPNRPLGAEFTLYLAERGTAPTSLRRRLTKKPLERGQFHSSEETNPYARGEV